MDAMAWSDTCVSCAVCTCSLKVVVAGAWSSTLLLCLGCRMFLNML
jgi:hypothetical protein